MAENDAKASGNAAGKRAGFEERYEKIFGLFTDYRQPTDKDENFQGRKQIEEQRAKQAQERDNRFTVLVDQFVKNYADKYNQNKKFKGAFFWWVMVLFTFVFLLPLLIVILIAGGCIEQMESVAALATSLGTIITAMIVIPKIIAEYLFSLKEDETIIKIILELHSGDTKEK